jgi:hypothetical protein
MNFIKKVSLSVAAVAVLATSSFSGQVLSGGNIPLINTVTGVGVLTLDLASDGNDVNIASFVVNCNAPTYTVSWVLTNGGNFMSGDIADNRFVPMTAMSLALSASNNGTLGTGGAAPVNVIAHAALGTPTAAADWTVNQTTATENYMIDLVADWSSASTSLAGLYTEQIVFTITATL